MVCVFPAWEPGVERREERSRPVVWPEPAARAPRTRLCSSLLFSSCTTVAFHPFRFCCAGVFLLLLRLTVSSLLFTRGWQALSYVGPAGFEAALFFPVLGPTSCDEHVPECWVPPTTQPDHLHWPLSLLKQQAFRSQRVPQRLLSCTLCRKL